jgi:guanylate kinase
MSGKNNIFIISAPSGAGKSTLIQLLIEQNHKLTFSVSHTTRPPRSGEADGVDYYFVQEEQFRRMIEKGELLEWAQVHDYLYGTSRLMLEKAAKSGTDLILDIDVQGAMQVKKLIPDAISIFILPPSFESLRDRLLHRRKDTDQQIARRIENAKREISHCKEYDYIIINRDVKVAFDDLSCILRSQRLRRENQEKEIEGIMRSFQL